MAAPITERLRAAAAENTQLLQSLEEVSDAPQALLIQTSNAASLTAQITDSEHELSRLKAATARELADHKKFRDSKIRRRLGNKDKFAAQAAVEEREYHEALLAQRSAEDALAELRLQLEQAQAAKAELAGPVERQRLLQAQLDTLYADVFAAPTPELPAQEAAKSAFVAAEARTADAQRAAETERKAIELLGAAWRKMMEAQKEMHKAQNAATWDLLGGGKTAALVERGYIDSAQFDMQLAQKHLLEARHLQAQIAPVPGVDRIEFNMWTQAIFDNIFTDVQVYRKIDTAQEQIALAIRKLNRQIDLALEREKELRRDLLEAMDQLEIARAELQFARTKAFESVGSKI